MKITALIFTLLLPGSGLLFAQMPSGVLSGDSLPVHPVTIITYDSSFYEFGKVMQGAMVRHTFHFTNTGKEPYLIEDVKTTCGCTVPVWTRDTIAPGGTGEVHVDFNTGGKSGRQLKIIRVVGNTEPGEMILQLSGEIKIPKKRKAKG